MKKRVISLLIVICLVILQFSATALADEQENTTNIAPASLRSDSTGSSTWLEGSNPSNNADGQTPLQQHCCCNILCTENAPNSECPVCSAEDAQLSQVCKGAPAEQTCICTNACGETNTNPDCPICSANDADLSACLGASAAPALLLSPAPRAAGWTFDTADSFLKSADGSIKLKANAYGTELSLINNYNNTNCSGDLDLTGTITGTDGETYTLVSIGDASDTINGQGIFAEDLITSVKLPDTVRIIHDGAFRHCTQLTRVQLGSGVETIGSEAFSSCSALREITLPQGVTSIGESAFQKCSSLESITLPAGLTQLGNNAFSNTAIKSITIPGSVQTIGQYAFDNCQLESVVIEEGVTAIGTAAFRNNRNLKSVSLPDSLRTIGQNAFEACSKLEQIALPHSLQTIGESAFAGCSALKEIQLPDSLQTIGGSAWKGCTSITILIIPASVGRFTGSAIDGCENLQSIIFLGTPPTLTAEESLIAFLDDGGKIYIPADKRPEYESAAEWKDIAGRLLDSGLVVAPGEEYSFDPLYVGYGPSEIQSKIFTVYNYAESELTGLSVQIGEMDGERKAFDLDTTGMKTALVPGESTTFTVTPKTGLPFDYTTYWQEVTIQGTTQSGGNVETKVIVTLRVNNPGKHTISPMEPVNVNPKNPQDISYTLTRPYLSEVEGIKIGEKTLVKDTDYTVSTTVKQGKEYITTVTVKASCLQQLATGDYSVSFTMSRGTAQEGKIHVLKIYTITIQSRIYDSEEWVVHENAGYCLQNGQIVQQVQVVEGESATLTAVANSGYTFDSWSNGAGSESEEATFTYDSRNNLSGTDETLYMHFLVNNTKELVVGGVRIVQSIPTYLKNDENGNFNTWEANEDNYVIKFDPETSTLTLRNATIRWSTLEGLNIGKYGGILAPGNLTIELIGENRITGRESADDNPSYGILVENGNLIFTGTGSLTLDSGKSNNEAIGLKADGRVTFAGQQITITGQNRAIDCQNVIVSPGGEYPVMVKTGDSAQDAQAVANAPFNEEATLTSTQLQGKYMASYLAGALDITVTWPTASAITYGQALKDSALTGGQALDEEKNPVAGTFAWQTPALTPAAGQIGCVVTFTPDDDRYASASNTVSIEVQRATPQVAWKESSQTVTYSGNQVVITAPEVTLVNGESFSNGEISYQYRLDGEQDWHDGLPVNAGSYRVKASVEVLQSQNYNVGNTQDELQLTVEKCKVTVTADSLSKSYGQIDPELTWKITSGSQASGEPLAIELARQAGEDAGEYQITLAEGINLAAQYPNYDITFVSGKFTIQQANISLDYTLDPPAQKPGREITVTLHVENGEDNLMQSGFDQPQLEDITVEIIDPQGNKSVVSMQQSEPGVYQGSFALAQDALTGEWNIAFVHANTQNYAAYSQTGSFTVGSQGAVTMTLTADSPSMVYSETITYTVTVQKADKNDPDPLDGKVQLYIDGTAVYLPQTLSDGVCVFVVQTRILDYNSGNPHTITAEYTGNDYFAAATAQTTTLVEKREVQWFVNTAVAKEYDGTKDLPAGFDANQIDILIDGIVEGDLLVAIYDSITVSPFSSEQPGAYMLTLQVEGLQIAGDGAENYDVEKLLATPITITGTIYETQTTPAQPAEEDGKQYQVKIIPDVYTISSELESKYWNAEYVKSLLRKELANEGIAEENTVVYDVILLSSTDGQTWTEVAPQDFPAAGVTITIPYPQGTGQNTHDFVVVHMFDRTANGHNAGDIETLTATETSAGLQMTVTALSPMGIGFKENSSSGTDTNSGSTSSDDYRDGEYDFWQRVKQQIEAADPGDTIKANAKGYDRMPVSVMEALRNAENVTLLITWNGGEDIKIPSSKALERDELRIYWALSYLEGLDFSVGQSSGSDQNNGDSTTGGKVEVTAPEEADDEQEVTPPDQGVVEEKPEQTPEQTPDDTPTANPDAEQSESSTSGYIWIFVMTAVLATAVIIILIYKKRKAQ